MTVERCLTAFALECVEALLRGEPSDLTAVNRLIANHVAAIAVDLAQGQATLLESRLAARAADYAELQVALLKVGIATAAIAAQDRKPELRAV